MSIFKIFDTDNDIVANQKQVITSGLWSSGAGSLTTFFTSSVQSGSSGAYYYDLYKTDPASDTAAEKQFDVTYGNYLGSGSILTHSGTDNGASKAMYSQFAQLLLGPSKSQFIFTPSKTVDSIYVVTVDRSRLREKLDPGNWELHLDAGTTKIKLIDDSGGANATTVDQGGRVYNVVSGSITSGTAVVNTTAAAETTYGAYGLFYPDLGILVFNGDRLDVAADLNIGTVLTSNANGNNSGKLYDAVKTGASFDARREENISSTHYFCRVYNKEFNFSSNPTFFTSSDGSMTNTSFVNDPQVYPTTVGLYNDNNELLAVAKMSQPLLKNFSRECIVKVKLDF